MILIRAPASFHSFPAWPQTTGLTKNCLSAVISFVLVVFICIIGLNVVLLSSPSHLLHVCKMLFSFTKEHKKLKHEEAVGAQPEQNCRCRFSPVWKAASVLHRQAERRPAPDNCHLECPLLLPLSQHPTPTTNTSTRPEKILHVTGSGSRLVLRALDGPLVCHIIVSLHPEWKNRVQTVKSSLSLSPMMKT